MQRSTNKTEVVRRRKSCRRWTAGGSRDADVAAKAKPAGVGSSAPAAIWLVCGQNRGVSAASNGAEHEGRRGDRKMSTHDVEVVERL